MSVPAATITELDGQLGILPTSAGQLEAIVGDAAQGPLNTPAAFARARDVITTFGGGPLVEDACYAIEHFGKVVVLCRTDRTTDGAASSVDDAGVTGTSVPSVDTGSLKPWYSGEWVFQVIAGGTIGVAGITFRYSDDGGRTWSRKTALGTANTYTVPTSGVVIDFAAGTLVAADEFTFTTTEPKWAAADLTDALEAIRLSSQPIEYVSIVGACSGTEKDTVNAAADAAHASNRHRFFICRARLPNSGESEATYLASLTANFADKEHTSVSVGYGAARIRSSIPSRPSQMRRSPTQAVAPLFSAVSAEVDIAKKSIGPLHTHGVALKDSNGNPVEHDEEANPGADDVGFLTLRSYSGKGVYVNNPRIMCPDGSDFNLVQYRRVMNDARTALQAYLEERLHSTILVDKATGHILETEALEIEAGANGVLDTALLRRPKASAAVFVLSRTDNVLSTQTITYDVRIVPLGYAKFITGTIAFANPAKVVAV